MGILLEVPLVRTTMKSGGSIDHVGGIEGMERAKRTSVDPAFVGAPE